MRNGIPAMQAKREISFGLQLYVSDGLTLLIVAVRARYFVLCSMFWEGARGGGWWGEGGGGYVRGVFGVKIPDLSSSDCAMRRAGRGRVFHFVYRALRVVKHNNAFACGDMLLWRTFCLAR